MKTTRNNHRDRFQGTESQIWPITCAISPAGIVASRWSCGMGSPPSGHPSVASSYPLTLCVSPTSVKKALPTSIHAVSFSELGAALHRMGCLWRLLSLGGQRSCRTMRCSVAAIRWFRKPKVVDRRSGEEQLCGDECSAYKYLQGTI